jgi:hypothetical protein
MDKQATLPDKDWGTVLEVLAIEAELMDTPEKMYRVTLRLSTAVTAIDKWAAIMAVEDILPDEFQFGEPGNILPFEFDGLTAEKITDEDIGRG